MSDHFTLDELRAFIRGHNPEEESLLLDHCRTCAECGDQLAAMLALTSSQSSRHSGAGKKYLWVGAMAATLVVVIAVAVVFRTIVVDEISAEYQELAALATTETLPGTAVQFDLRFNELAPAAVGRGIPQIREGGELLVAGEYAAAITALEREYLAHPDSSLVSTYLGTARYLSGDDSPEVGRLLAAGVGTGDTRTSASSYAEWYLGNYLLRVGRVDEAVEVLDMVAALEGRLGREALVILDEIRKVRER